MLILRGELIPLLHLPEQLGLTQTYFDPHSGTYKPDRRSGLVDERREKATSGDEQEVQERKENREQEVNIVIV